MTTWKITLNELFHHRGGTSIFSTFSVNAPPTATVSELIEIIQKSPNNGDSSDTTAQSLAPFNPASIGHYDHTADYKFLSENPDATPNCSWDPSPSKTIAEAGLCDGAVLSFSTSRICD